MVTVIIQEAQVVGLFQLAKNDIEMIAILCSDQRFGNVIFHSFLIKLQHGRIVEFTLGRQNKNRASAG